MLKLAALSVDGNGRPVENAGAMGMDGLVEVISSGGRFMRYDGTCSRLWRVLKTGTCIAVRLAIILCGPHDMVVESALERER
jgi:hypothetical protein